MAELAHEGKAQIARLYVDARPIAAIILLRSGDLLHWLDQKRAPSPKE